MKKNQRETANTSEVERKERPRGGGVHTVTPRAASKGMLATGCSLPVFPTQHGCGRITNKAWLRRRVPRRDTSSDIPERLDSPNETTECGLASIEVGKDVWDVEARAATGWWLRSRRYKELNGRQMESSSIRLILQRLNKVQLETP